ncbi:MAG: glycoside hydrolase family 30 beta sandwich domain-containing protein [Paenibacillus macerans]|uniref:glycoside hydrolase family 30 beta sandwich domain-containing protein n=1 Tax=Paenibacillus TaxID=44249 RepID=UPI0029117A48|nr:glycoside hydrolase family 30 beta sandwich domain-containing protein [Paenibacillus macerans]MDU7474938.1 glycoside hydrolase family 30 beta sandwich domain-containing protein [Paenibacillus macerans]
MCSGGAGRSRFLPCALKPAPFFFEKIETGFVPFRNSYGGMAVVVQNETETAQSFVLELGGENVTETLPAHSIATYIIKG